MTPSSFPSRSSLKWLRKNNKRQKSSKLCKKSKKTITSEKRKFCTWKLDDSAIKIIHIIMILLTKYTDLPKKKKVQQVSLKDRFMENEGEG